MQEQSAQHIEEYIAQLESSNLSSGYRALMEYLMSLRIHFINKYSEAFTVGTFHQGLMNLSYFPIKTKTLSHHNLKFGLIFNHEKIQFEIWLLGRNKQIQEKYWNLLRQTTNKYLRSTNAHEAIIQHVLIAEPDFKQLNLLTQRIDDETVKFMADVSGLLISTKRL